jgi:hypothetical protein
MCKITSLPDQKNRHQETCYVECTLYRMANIMYFQRISFYCYKTDALASLSVVTGFSDNLLTATCDIIAVVFIVLLHINVKDLLHGQEC